MSLVDKLMAIDKGKFALDKTAEIEAKHMSEVLGEKVMISVKAITGEQYTDITARAIDKKGNLDISRMYDVNALLVVAGLVEPNLADSALQKHFGAATPKDLAKILFPGTELALVSSKITELSGFATEDTEAEIKN